MILGIDPGRTGAAVLISQDRRLDLIRFMKYNRKQIAGWFATQGVLSPKTYLENVHAMEHDGVASAHKFGRNTGFLEGCLTMLDIDAIYVDPKTWQYAFGLGGKHGPPGCTRSQEKTARKNAHKRKAQEIFPNLDVTLDLCDALLLAEYGWRRTYGGIYEPNRDNLRPGVGVVRIVRR